MLCISRMLRAASTPAILHRSTVIQGNSFALLLNGLLAELPAILDSFFTSTTSDYIGVVGRGWWGATKWRGKHTSSTDTLIENHGC